jgi:Holliday junction resolvase-like predicted endonuclease
MNQKRIIDFTEIAESGTGSGYQDDFEFFAQAFLESQGYFTIQRPARGPDGGVDLIVEERRSFRETIRWLVSAKHKAHGKRSVGLDDEKSIHDDVIANQCQGFLAIYSTIMGVRVRNNIDGIARNGDIETRVYQARELESLVIKDSSPTSVFATYFPQSYAKFMKKHFPQGTTHPVDDLSTFTDFSEAMAILRIHELRIKLMMASNKKEEKIFTSMMAYSYIGSVRVLAEVVSIAGNVLAGETKHTDPLDGDRPSLVYYVLTKFFEEERLFQSVQEYGPVIREIVYLGTRYTLRRSYYHEPPLPAASLISLIKHVYHELKRVGDHTNQKFITDQLQVLKADIKNAETEYGPGYLKMIAAFEDVFDHHLMGIPPF